MLGFDEKSMKINGNRWKIKEIHHIPLILHNFPEQNLRPRGDLMTQNQNAGHLGHFVW